MHSCLIGYHRKLGVRNREKPNGKSDSVRSRLRRARACERSCVCPRDDVVPHEWSLKQNSAAASGVRCPVSGRAGFQRILHQQILQQMAKSMRNQCEQPILHQQILQQILDQQLFQQFLQQILNQQILQQIIAKSRCATKTHASMESNDNQ
jgi:hypothetical protein